MMNILPLYKRIQIVECLVNGLSLSTTSIVTDVSKNTIIKLQLDVGKDCQAFHERTVNQLTSTNEVFCSAIWSFPGVYGKSVRTPKLPRLDDIWTFIAIDRDSELILSYKLGTYHSATASAVLRDLKFRVKTPYHLSADSAKLYLDLAEQATDKVEDRTAPDIMSSDLDLSLTLGDKKLSDRSAINLQQEKFFKKIETCSNALSLHIVYHNFFKESKISNVTSAMRAGLKDRPLPLAYFVRLRDLI